MSIVDVSVSHVSGTGIRYRVDLDGETIIASTKQPFHDAARELSRRGITGRMQTRRDGVICMSGLIAVAATQRVAESEHHGPRFARYVPRDFGGAE